MTNKTLLLKKCIAMVLIIWLLLIGLYLISRYYQLQINISSSMPQRLWLTYVGDINLTHGDYVVIKFHDKRMSNPNDFEYVVKQVAGIAHDEITVHEYPDVINPKLNKTILILNQQLFPVFPTLSGNNFNPLTTKNIVIPDGCYFLHGQNDPSFDSRYKEFGLICNQQIYGKTSPIF